MKNKLGNRKEVLFVINMNRTQEMTDAIHGFIAYSGIEGAVIGTPIFNRLHKILQNSLVYLTYPANKVKRFEHSIGTMHLAGQFFFHSICNSSPEWLEYFFGEINQELVKWNKDVSNNMIPYIHSSVRQKFNGSNITLAPYPLCPLYTQNTPACLEQKNKFGYYVAYQAIRLAGLLHDVGHLPYSHVLEHSLKSLHQEILSIPESNRKSSHCNFLNVMGKYCGIDAEFEIHEELGQKFVKKIFQCILEGLSKEEIDEIYFLVATLYFTEQILIAKEGTNSLFSDLHRIVAGTLDCDRMDYCCRDGYCTGISRELYDYNRIFSTVNIIYRPEPLGIAYENAESDSRERCYFVPSTKALREIELLLRRRWDIYSTINYHHRVHKYELLLEKVLVELGKRELNEDDKDREQDTLMNVLPLKVSSFWKLIEQMDGHFPMEYIALQLDDSWLDTLLKHKYFEFYGNNYLSFKENAKDIMWHRLDELISTQKHYFSLFKRSGGFRNFDELIYNTLKEKQKTEHIDCLNIKLHESYSGYIGKEGEYIFNRILRENIRGKEQRNKFFRDFNQSIQTLISDRSYNIADCFLADSSFSKGIKMSDQLYISSLGNDEKPFIHYSALYNTLNSEKKLLPCFHAYYLPEYDTKHNEYYVANTSEFLENIATNAIQILIKFITSLAN